MTSFIEIDNPNLEEDALPEWIDCYVVANIDPKCCGPLARDLNAVIPLRTPNPSHASVLTSTPSSAGDQSADTAVTIFPKTDHLKRIRRRPATADEISSREKSEALQRQTSQNTCNANNVAEDNDGIAKGKDANSLEPSQKRPKKNKKNNQRGSVPWSLDILIGSVASVDYHSTTISDGTIIESDKSPPPSLETILKRYNLSVEGQNFVRQSLPGRPARTKDELDQWNQSAWPTLFFEEKTVQYKEEQMALTSEEVAMMKKGMNEACKDALVGRKQWKERKAADTASNGEQRVIPTISGVVVMNPDNGCVVSRASEERLLQSVREKDIGNSDVSNKSASAKCNAWSSFPDEANLLCTSALLAIQGVSRVERQVALGCGIESEEFRSGQYICTGYDVYLTKEPNVYEAMALVHSRVRRVVFGVTDREMGGLGGAAANKEYVGIHCLPGTNHHYRAFRLEIESNSDCQEDTLALIDSLKGLHNDLLI